MSEAPCSDAARRRGDRWVGTAPPARRWFLVTKTGDWDVDAWQGLHADPDTKAVLREMLAAAGARLMLIRRPGRHQEQPSLWGIVDSASTPRIRWGAQGGDDDLLLAARSLLAAAPHPHPGGSGSEEGPLLLVCTHGRKDRCCAVRGRPVAAAAAEQWPDATWECTHTGGDRFAGNLIVLPDGACYGGLDASDVGPVVAAHLAGRVDPAHLRGPTGMTPATQAAVVAVHERWGPLAWSDVVAARQSGDAARWSVHLRVTSIGRVRVTGHTELTPPHLLTCDAVRPSPMALPVVDAVERLTSEEAAERWVRPPVR
ncbi:sucrase ferredoxin [Raineyella fluvialis]|uniref:Sucrase ferredoxin n=1 Tax=Raineyella fluvialis TaxID=2662261 RepID=A0A5Q2FER8_9ACTN|nr:sucrase ferredoxin [Raineyella fluvialis]QGF24307.1 sucrase ferredoxin [Raineyella fluvialis]